MLRELVPQYHIHLWQVSVSRSLDEKCENTSLIKPIVLPADRFLVRELLRFRPELGDSRLLTKMVADIWPFSKLYVFSFSQHPS